VDDGDGQITFCRSTALARQSAGVAAVYRAWGYVWLETVRIEDWTTLVLRRPG
jgi:hypothetical protein